jgi:glutathione reductase (NADPH)
MRFKRTFTDPVPQARLKTYEDAGIAVLHGQTAFKDPARLIVGSDEVYAEHIVIASGAQEVHVARGDDVLLTSETFLALEQLPETLIFVGGGYIAFEFAHVASRAGARVTILHNDAHPLAGFDPGIVERLLQLARAAGITIETDTPVQSVERSEDGIVVHAGRNGEKAFRAHAGVLAAGRAPNLEHLQLERGNVQRTKKGVDVNDFLQSVSNPRVYAAGDSADAHGLPLTPVAGYTGEIAAENITGGNSRKPGFRGLATMVYTIPPLGSVGLSESQAREQGAQFEIHAGDMSDWYSTRYVAAHAAFYKLLTEKGTRKLLGATVLGPHAEEQINVLSLAIRSSLRADDVADVLFAYPTGASDLEYLVR